MSSILKALKKIEEEAPPPETFPSLPQPMDSRQTLNSKTLKRRRVRKTLAFLVLLVAVGVAAGLFVSQRRMIIAKILPTAATSNKNGSAAEHSPDNRIYKAKIAAAPEKSAQLRSAEKQQRQNQARPSISRSNANKFQAHKSTSPSRAAADQGKSESSIPRPEAKAKLNAKIEKPLRRSPTIISAPPTEESAAHKDRAPMEPAAAAAQKKSQTASKVSYDRIEDSKLKLQALAWSADDARRMAVINGRIVREGESVDGYEVMQIREEDVVVNDGGKSWRLEFGMQR